MYPELSLATAGDAMIIAAVVASKYLRMLLTPFLLLFVSCGTCAGRECFMKPAEPAQLVESCCAAATDEAALSSGKLLSWNEKGPESALFSASGPLKNVPRPQSPS